MPRLWIEHRTFRSSVWPRLSLSVVAYYELDIMIFCIWAWANYNPLHLDTFDWVRMIRFSPTMRKLISKKVIEHLTAIVFEPKSNTISFIPSSFFWNTTTNQNTIVISNYIYITIKVFGIELDIIPSISTTYILPCVKIKFTRMINYIIIAIKFINL